MLLADRCNSLQIIGFLLSWDFVIFALLNLHCQCIFCVSTGTKIVIFNSKLQFANWYYFCCSLIFLINCFIEKPRGAWSSKLVPNIYSIDVENAIVDASRIVTTLNHCSCAVGIL